MRLSQLPKKSRIIPKYKMMPLCLECWFFPRRREDDAGRLTVVCDLEVITISLLKDFAWPSHLQIQILSSLKQEKKTVDVEKQMGNKAKCRRLKILTQSELFFFSNNSYKSRSILRMHTVTNESNSMTKESHNHSEWGGEKRS